MSVLTKFDRNVKWLEPFFEAASDLIPARKLSRVIGYRVPLEKEHKSEAQCTEWCEDGRVYFHISLALDVHYTFNGVKRSIRRASHYTLSDFAHELAHVKYMDHSPNHWDLECRIRRRFTRVMRKFNIKNTDGRRPLKPREK